MKVQSRELAEEKLHESEIRYRRLFESAEDGILILDFTSGNIVDANPFIINLMDYQLKNVLGKKLWEIGLFKNKEQSELAFSELKEKGYIRFEDMPLQTLNGKITEVEFVSNVYLEGHKKVIQCNIRDTSRRKHADQALKNSQQNLKEQNTSYLNLNNEYTILNNELSVSLNDLIKINSELKSEKIRADGSDKLKSSFLANMSHEIRTPMNAIMGFSDLLLQPGLSKEKLADFVQIIRASSLQLLTVISDIIDISKIEAGQITINSELVNINNLMNELFITYTKLVEFKKLKLSYFSNSTLDHIQIKTDGNRIKQVLCNLLNNAIKFTREGEVEFGFKITGNFIEFYVRDTGIGISADNQALIFQRFRQIDSGDNKIYGGNGLGLSISKALIEKLGGILKVESQFTKGSTFTFTIPYSNIVENPSSHSSTPGSDQFINWNKKTILIAEDEVVSHAYIKELLSDSTIKTIHAWDGNEAVELVKKYPDISLVLMDIKMPGLDGYEATQLIKKIRPELPVIAQTAFALSHDREQALEAGCDNYIAKPIQRNELLELIACYLNPK